MSLGNIPTNTAVTYSVVIPVYNSEKTIETLCQGLDTIFTQRQVTYEVLLINDASVDLSWKILKKIHEANDKVKIVRFMKNFGQQNALLCGFSYAAGEYVITMDDDLQHSPTELPKLMAAMGDNVDVVIAALAEKKDRAFKKIGSRLIRYLNRKIFNIPKSLQLSSFRILRREVVTQMMRINTPYPYITGLIFSHTDRVVNATVEHQPRSHGRSNYNLRKLVSLAFNLIINYSSIPLRILTFFGMLVSISAFLIGSYFLIKKIIIGSAIQGWTSTVVLLSFFNGILLAVLSVMGEYLVRILGEISNRPSFMIREKRL